MQGLTEYIYKDFSQNFNTELLQQNKVDQKYV